MGYSDERVMLAVCGRLKIGVEEYNYHLQRKELRCTRCKQWKDFSEFVSCKIQPRGITSICNICNVKQAQEYVDNNRELVMQKIHNRYFLDVENSRKNSRERNAKYRNESPEKRVACLKRYLEKPGVRERLYQSLIGWRKNNPDKRRLQTLVRRDANREIDFDGERFVKLREYYAPDSQCMCCGEIKELEIDHIIPVWHGGKSIVVNLQFLCRSCNAKKNAKTIDYRPDGGEFARQLKNQE